VPIFVFTEISSSVILRCSRSRLIRAPNDSTDRLPLQALKVAKAAFRASPLSPKLNIRS